MSPRAPRGLVVWLCLGAWCAVGQKLPADAPLKDAPAKAAVAKEPAAALSHASGKTPCAVCHTVASWAQVTFNHERTGFPLAGAHRAVTCSACHVGSEFSRAVPTSCRGCHKDPHASEFGAQCAGCHDEKSWRPFFNADAHRRTRFPLIGRHAALPCQECHQGVRDRAFAQAPVVCVACHGKELDRAQLSTVPHQALGFGVNCQHCHDAWRWEGARDPAHDACFLISFGVHAGIRCASCHTQLGASATSGACATHTAACTGCHSHSQSISDAQHTSVEGYQFKDLKCYECHQFTRR